MFLTGTYRHNLDAKSRVTLPATFRRQVDEQVLLVPFNGALYGFTPDAYREWLGSVFPAGLNPRNAKDVRLQRAIASSTTTVDVDSAGRIALGKLPAQQLAQCGLVREVAIVGNIDHFEIWDAQTFDQQMAETSPYLDSLMFSE